MIIAEDAFYWRKQATVARAWSSRFQVNKERLSLVSCWRLSVVEVRVTTRSEGDEDKNKQGNLDINIYFEIRFLLGEEWRCLDS